MTTKLECYPLPSVIHICLGDFLPLLFITVHLALINLHSCHSLFPAFLSLLYLPQIVPFILDNLKLNKLANKVVPFHITFSLFRNPSDMPTKCFFEHLLSFFCNTLNARSVCLFTSFTILSLGILQPV